MVVLAGVNPVANFLQGQADYFSTLGLPGWLVQWVSAACAPCPAATCRCGREPCMQLH